MGEKRAKDKPTDWVALGKGITLKKDAGDFKLHKRRVLGVGL